MKIENRFRKYISFNTQSHPYSTTCPSTTSQKEFGQFLMEEMRILGFQDIQMSQYGIVYGKIPSNNKQQGDVMGFIAHIDTSPEVSGENIKTQIIREYNGDKILLQNDMYLSPEEFPDLLKVVGHDLITTDGRTLLGGDDKAGIAIIMSMAEYLYKHPEFKHNDIYIAFTPDEEIGRGIEHFDLGIFKAEYAYTVDGGDINAFSFENFNAYEVIVDIQGKSIHPGIAKNKMVNAIEVAQEFNSLLPQHKRPEFTDNHDGFHHLHILNGTCEKAHLEYIVRDHQMIEIQNQLDDFEKTRAYLNMKYGYELIHIKTNEQYLNMRDIIKDTPAIVEQIEIAMEDIGLQPMIIPIRGGTDGASLSYKGLPCPNIGTGAFNCHSPYEFVSIDMMKQGVKLILKMIKNNVTLGEDLPF